MKVVLITAALARVLFSPLAILSYGVLIFVGFPTARALLDNSWMVPLIIIVVALVLLRKL